MRAATEGIKFDEATKDSIKLLNLDTVQYDTEVLDLKNLLRYDVFEGDKTPQEWIELCMQNPNETHGLSPVCENYQYSWKPV